MIKKEKDNNTELQTFLNSAIADISGYVKFLDTKVSIIMAALGVVIAGIINCRNLIMDTYNIVKVDETKCMILIAIVMSLLTSIFYVYFWKIRTLMAHNCNIQYESVWFIRKEIAFEKYRKKVKKMDSNDITDTMIAELYKLNYINKMKMRFISKTIKAFGASIIILVIVLAYVGIVNMMNVVNK